MLYMLTGLKVPSLTCKGGPHGTEFWRSWNAEMKQTNG